MKYSDFQASEFFSFFNLVTSSSEQFSSELKKVSLKTGGFQEHIDIYVYMTGNRDIVKAELYLDREWIGNVDSINPFGADLSKSFLQYFLPTQKDSEFKKHLVHYLYNLRGKKQVIIPLHQAFREFEESIPAIIPYLEVYRNNKKKMQRNKQNYILTMENITQNLKKRLLIRIRL
ncbi:MAG: hypothetical protein BAJALOKI3v1_160061 [Promethearchaeota archaeon]|jgi:hypothetical protein|nr:MAG: hypothetical protein BAJALOKI3v1_160061 [Candidatus Lokiarchaeota archaeon]